MHDVDGSERQDSGPFSAAAVNLASADASYVTPIRGIWVGTTGDIKVDMAHTGSAITFSSVPVGYLAVHVTKIYKTGTTASNLVAVY